MFPNKNQACSQDTYCSTPHCPIDQTVVWTSKYDGFAEHAKNIGITTKDVESNLQIVNGGKDTVNSEKNTSSFIHAVANMTGMLIGKLISCSC